MSEETNLVVASAGESAFSMSMFKKVKGLDENSPLKRMKAMGTPRLTVVGNKFVIRSGKNEQVLRGADKRPLKELDVVIHSFSPDIQRQLSAPWNNDNPQFTPLGCWSNDGDTPDEGVWDKKSEDCDTCDSKFDCSLSRNLVVSLYSPDVEPEHPMVFTTNWSSNSTKKKGDDIELKLFGLINYLAMLAGEDVETYKVITRLVIDDFSDNKPANNCKVLFQPVNTLTPSSPNWAAHTKWEEEGKDLSKMIRIEQRPPEDQVVGDASGADEDELEADVTAAEEAAAKKAKAATAKKAKAAAAKKAKAEEAKAAEVEVEEEVEEEDDAEIAAAEAALAAKKKKAAAAKKAAAKKKKEEVVEEEEELSLDDLDEEEGEFTEEDHDDFGDLDDLLADD